MSTITLIFPITLSEENLSGALWYVQVTIFFMQQKA